VLILFGGGLSLAAAIVVITLLSSILVPALPRWYAAA
jgi:hypothetical protein